MAIHLSWFGWYSITFNTYLAIEGSRNALLVWLLLFVDLLGLFFGKNQEECPFPLQ